MFTYVVSAAAAAQSIEGPEMDAVYHQHLLLTALENANLRKVREVLSHIPGPLRKAVLLLPSKRIEYKLRTPLMAGAATGVLAILGGSLIVLGGAWALSGLTRPRMGERRTGSSTQNSRKRPNL